MPSPESNIEKRSSPDTNLEEHEPNKKDTSDSNSKLPTSFNPNLPEGEESEVLERLRGDAIGSTLYTERFVISTLLKLREMKETLDNDEKFEKELESLWDMTIEEDVVLKLIDLDVYEIFTQSIINYEKDSRLVEILVGIIGNMCTVSKKALEQICENETTIEVLLQLIACGDSCVLLQLMRLITVVYGNLEAALIWNRKIMTYSEFIEHFCFILNNSTNQTLLSHALETLNATLARCATIKESNNDDDDNAVESKTTILQRIISSNLIASTIEAFQTFYTKETEEHASNEPDEFDIEPRCTSESLKKMFLSFLYIHDIFLEYRPEAYNNDTKSGVLTCFNIIINTISTVNFVMPENIDYLHEMLESLLQIYLVSDTLHNEETIERIINLWQILKTNIDTSSNGNKETTNDFETDDLELNESFKELCILNEELLIILLKNYNADTLTNIFKRCEGDIAQKIFKLCGLNIKDYNDENIKTYCAQLEKTLHTRN